MRETQDLLDEIYPLIHSQANIAFPEFGFKRSGNGWEATEGEVKGEKAKGHLYHYDNSPFCFKNQKTGETITLWEYIQDKKYGYTKQEILEELAKLARYALPDLTGYSKEKAEQAREKAKGFETALTFFKSRLWEDEGRQALDYLINERKYTKEEIEAMELGLFPSTKETKDYLVNRDYSVNSLGLMVKGFGDTHKIVIPYRDPTGRLKGFIVRAIGDIKPKYLFSYGVEKDSPFNLNEARGQKDLIITEGFLDALIATQRGTKGVIALGGESITEGQLEAIIRHRVRNLILALDNDEAGKKGTEKALELINRKEGLNAFVVTFPKNCKDPDELIRAQGIEVFEKTIKQAQSGVKWKANYLLSKHDLKTDRGKQDALDEALAYEETLRDPIKCKDFLDVITQALEIPIELLEPTLKDYHEKKAGERLEKGYRELFREGSRLLEEGRITDLKEYVEGRVRDLKAKTVSRVLKPYGLKDLTEDVTQTREGLRTGYESLDNIIRIPQEAITIIAGRPSHGKTTLLMNLFLNMIRSYEDKNFFFFSYEESKRQIGLKLINILSGEVIDERKNLIELEEYIRGGFVTNERIEKGKEKFKRLSESGRLWIIDEPYFIDELTDVTAHLNKSYDIGGIFIDYVQKIKTKGRYERRQIEIQKISADILEIARSLSIPIIMGAQLGREKEHKDKVRLDNLREAGDLEQDANLVMGIYNEAMGKAQEREEPLRDKEVDLKLTILKNKNGLVNEEITLSFDRPILTIKDKQKNIYEPYPYSKEKR